MKKIIAILVSIFILTIGALACSNSIQAELFYRDISIVLNGKEIVTRDVNGDSTEPFIYNDTVYVPVRSIANNLGLNVEWNEDTSEVILTSIPNNCFTLETGYYIVGKDISPGTYTCFIWFGEGNINGKISEISNEFYELFKEGMTYDNLILSDGDSFNISGNIQIIFTEQKY
jgi:uncharacterized secreted protein with C-terminal beta-propeller domain